MSIDLFFWVDCVIIPLSLLGSLSFYLFALHTAKIIHFNVAAFKSLFFEVENEPSSKFDLQFITDQICYTIALSTTTLSLLVSYHEVIGSPAVLNAVMLLTYILALPASISLICGTYIMNYLKGEAQSNSILYAGVFDFANFFGFFKRFLIQFVRYVLISIKIALFNIFVGECTRQYKLWQALFYNPWTDWYSLPVEFLHCVRDSIIDVLHFFWELSNIFIIYYAQLGAFVIVLFWLLKALYSSAWPIIKLVWYKYLKRN